MASVKRILFFACLGLVSVSLLALELALDASYSGSTQVDDWGASTHIQVKGSKPYGVDLGYKYLNSISYSALGTQLNHSMGQYEGGLFWQAGDKGFRFQALAGVVMSNSWIQSAGNDVVRQYAPGYQVGLGVSVPLFTRFRVFAETGYQGWLDAEIPAHLNWRYGIRFLIGGNSVQPLEAVEQAQTQAAAEQAQAEQENPTVTIDPQVPEFIPGPYSQSLPPIVAHGEICKCYPAGPYTLQLGEFNNLSQATRALEYRGLRQFFNSRAYLKAPLPVFLAQNEPAGPVGVYLGELASIEQMQFWRHELRKSGLQAKYRKVVGANGERIPNPMVDVEPSLLAGQPKYTEEEIRRMNSLPEDWSQETINNERSDAQLMQEKEIFDTEVAKVQSQLNALDEPMAVVDDAIQLGPLPMQKVVDLYSSQAMRSVLARNPNIKMPQTMRMTWDESNNEAWLAFSRFTSEQHLDEWLAWFSGESIPAERVKKAFVPMGDVYQFELGQALQEFSVEIAREDTMAKMIQQMRSPEVLWFQAYQRINQNPLATSLNWSETDQRYHLIISNINSRAQQQAVWANLTSVGLLPSLAEQ